MTDTVILVPVLGRPHRVAPLLESIEASGADVRVLFLATRTDKDMIDALDRAGAEVILTAPRPMGDFQTKINLGLAVTDEPFVFTGADDLHFHDGWLKAALAEMDDPAIGVVGTQDLCNVRTIAGDHSTHVLVRRSYAVEQGTVDEPGKIFHEGYWHEWCDDECVATAKHRKAWAFAADSIVEHLHPQVGKAPMDDLYAMQRHRIVQGRRLYRLREHMWST